LGETAELLTFHEAYWYRYMKLLFSCGKKTNFLSKLLLKWQNN